MRTLSPRRLAPDSWKRWLSDALALQSRRSGANLALAGMILAASYVLLHAHSPLIPVFVILVSGPLVLALFTESARRVDDCEPCLSTADGNGYVLMRLMALGWSASTILFPDDN